jgi:hypothetical protein
MLSEIHPIMHRLPLKSITTSSISSEFSEGGREGDLHRPGPDVVLRERDLIFVLRQLAPEHRIVGECEGEDAAHVRGCHAERRANSAVPRPAQAVANDLDLVVPPAHQVGGADEARVPRNQRHL